MSFGLRPRPAIPASELAAVTAAVASLASPSPGTAIDTDVTPAWRFSGRWFAGSPLNDQRRP